MLLSSIHTTSQPSYFAAYTPPRSSPLAERSANCTTRVYETNMSSPLIKKSKPILQRAYKPNPALQTRDAAAKRRRDVFFRRIQTDRDDKKWEMRGEQIQRLDFVSERKRWEAEKSRQAPPEIEEVDDNMIDDVVLFEHEKYTSQLHEETLEADHMLAQEEYEMQYYVSEMERTQDATLQHFGSDDEDLDAILMECANTADQHNEPQQNIANQFAARGEVMDVDVDMLQS